MTEGTLADIALVGGGFANTAALYKTLNQIRELKEDGDIRLKPHDINIRIYDVRHDLIGGGEAYAGSSPDMFFNMRTAMAIYDNYPDDNLIKKFGTWLSKDKDHWLKPLEAQSKKHATLQQWLLRARRADFEINQDYIPRTVFHQFMMEELWKMLEEAKELGVDVTLIQGRVEDISKTANGEFKLNLAEGSQRAELIKDGDEIVVATNEDPEPAKSIHATEAVLGIGYSGRTRFEKLEPYEKPRHQRYFSTQTTQEGDAKPRDQLLQDKIRQLWKEKSGKPNQKVRIAAIGMGPSYYDVISVLAAEGIRDKVEIVGFGKTQRSNRNNSRQHILDALNMLSWNRALDAVPKKISPQDITVTMNEGKSRGSFVSINCGKGRVEGFDMVINLTGRGEVLDHELIQSLVDKGIAQTQLDDKDRDSLKVSESFELSEGLYLNGAAASAVIQGTPRFAPYRLPIVRSIGHVDGIASKIAESLTERIRLRAAENTRADAAYETATPHPSLGEGASALYEGRLGEAQQPKRPPL